jgi:transposase
MLNTDENSKVYLACGDTDIRKSINGLTAIVENSFQLDPFEQALITHCLRALK